MKAVDLDQRMCAGGADCIGQDMTQILGAALDRGRTLGIGEVLLDGVIARQALQAAVSAVVMPLSAGSDEACVWTAVSACA